MVVHNTDCDFHQKVYLLFNLGTGKMPLGLDDTRVMTSQTTIELGTKVKKKIISLIFNQKSYKQSRELDALHKREKGGERELQP